MAPSITHACQNPGGEEPRFLAKSGCRSRAGSPTPGEALEILKSEIREVERKG